MDDSCAVCAEPLEWVAYGACGHRDVCSTCVARLRFICSDRRCCICKSESSVVFVTKALGDYTRMINDFSVLPSEVREGQVGSYWYHSDTQAFFDDVDHYRMIKAMCRLSCSVCDKMEEQQPNDGPKRRARFRDIDQLKGHLFHRHKLIMCSLCLEGRKIFICEQKLYTRAQLNQHINTGDAEVDGSESERGGFTGHPLCEFCRTPFYGDNELYSHMSTEHYTCHICQRQHPGQYEYYKNYDDLEMHFRQNHFLCEDEACLAKKFIVFQSESEIKRHNTIEHGGRMSRSKRNAALQIPTSFRFKSNNNAQEHRRGRGRSFHREPSDYQLSMAIQASLETSNVDDPPSSSRAQITSDFQDTDDIDPIIQPFEALTTDSESAARYRQALGQNSRNAPLQESSFPPLPLVSSSSQQKPKHESLGQNSRNAPLQESSFPPLSTGSSSSKLKPQHESEVKANVSMAAQLRQKNNKSRNLLSSAQGWPATSRGPALPVSNPIQVRPTTKVMPVASPSSGSGSATSSQAQSWPEKVDGPQSVGSWKSSGHSTRISHSASAPNLGGNVTKEPSASDFPPVSAANLRKLPALPNEEDVHTANKSLVEKIRSALDFDEDKYTTFKDVSGQYRQDLIDTKSYLEFVRLFGLSHLVIDLARLCPDPEKQKELIDTYNTSLKMTALQEDGRGPGIFLLKDGNGTKKGKGKHIVPEKQINSNDTLADNIISTVRKLQSNYKPSQEEEEVLSKDGYRAAKGKSSSLTYEQRSATGSTSQSSVKLKNQDGPSTASGGSNKSSGDGGVGSKQRKKTSKFHRVRLGDGSISALLDHKNSDSDPDQDPDPMNGRLNGSNPPVGLPTRGVWRKGGGQKLFSSNGTGGS